MPTDFYPAAPLSAIADNRPNCESTKGLAISADVKSRRLPELAGSRGYGRSLSAIADNRAVRVRHSCFLRRDCGSATLVLPTVLSALLLAETRGDIIFCGGCYAGGAHVAVPSATAENRTPPPRVAAGMF